MLMVCHHLNPQVPEDVAFAESRIRAETIMAEDILHDLGAISIMSSDSQAMGRVGEVIIRTWQTADKMKLQRGPLPGDSDRNDNARVKRYVAKYTINPAIDPRASATRSAPSRPGKLADLVLWKPAFFGVKPELVLKGGTDLLGGDGRPQRQHPDAAAGAWPGRCSAPSRPSATARRPSSPAAALDAGVPGAAGAAQAGGRGAATPATHRQARHDPQRRARPAIEVDPETYEVRADGELLVCEPARELPLAQRYFLF